MLELGLISSTKSIISIVEAVGAAPGISAGMVVAGMVLTEPVSINFRGLGWGSAETRDFGRRLLGQVDLR